MKYEVPNWHSALTEPRAKDTGCIPWGYEWMLRLVGAPCDFTRFQEEFNLRAQGIADNHFSNVAQAISKRYPSVEFRWQGFDKGEGMNKIRELKKRVAAGKPCVYSLAVFNSAGAHVGWDIMPVVSIEDDYFTLLFSF